MDVALAVGAHPTHYILISTDSVYMACQLPARTPETRDAKVREGDAVRPESAKAKVRLCEVKPSELVSWCWCSGSSLTQHTS